MRNIMETTKNYNKNKSDNEWKMYRAIIKSVQLLFLFFSLY